MAPLKHNLAQWLDQLTGKTCHHPKVLQTGEYCGDCGHKIVIDWLFVRCAHCNTKRPPARKPGTHNYKAEAVKPLHKFCKHCGTAEFITVKKSHIDAFELLFAVPAKHIDPQVPDARPVSLPSAQTRNPEHDHFISYADAVLAMSAMAGDTVPKPVTTTKPLNPSGQPFVTKPRPASNPFTWQPGRQVARNNAPPTNNPTTL
jgi:hypothetical protein